MQVAWDAVQHERVAFRIEPSQLCLRRDIVAPQSHGVCVRHQLALAGITDEGPAELAVDGEVAENVAASAVEKIGYGPQNFSLCAFARAGRTDQQNGPEFVVSFLHLCGESAPTAFPRMEYSLPRRRSRFAIERAFRSRKCG